jgi:hypothetical protein
MEPTTIVALGRLLFQVSKWVWEEVIDAENNSQLDNGEKKKTHVKQSILNRMEGYDPRRAPVTQDEVDEAKKLVASQIGRKIDVAVDTLNKKGHFVK